MLVALGVVIQDKKILMARRHDPKNSWAHNRWEFPGGKVEWREHPRDSMISEVAEEVGVPVRAHKLLGIYNSVNPGRSHVHIILFAYLARIKGVKKPAPACSEISEVRWFTLEEALRAPIIHGNERILRDLKKEL